MTDEAAASLTRYELLGELATGGMGTVYLGRQRGAHGFTRTVAIKSMHPQYAKDESFRAMFLDEANISGRARHPNVVPTLDVAVSSSKLLLVMEYVEGAPLSRLVQRLGDRGRRLELGVALSVLGDLLAGLHAAHEMLDDAGAPLGVVHRDVSPQNVLVGVDGLARVVDFGIAKARGRGHVTVSGEVKGKLGYMAPEQIFGEAVDRRADVYGTGVVLWEVLAGRRLFDAPNEGALVRQVTEGRISPPSRYADGISPALDALVLRALAPERDDRFPDAAAMRRALLAIAPASSRDEVGALVRDLAAPEIEAHASLLRSDVRGKLPIEAQAVLEALTRTIVEGNRRSETRRRLGLPLALALASAAVLSGVALARSTRDPAPAIQSPAPPPPPPPPPEPNSASAPVPVPVPVPDPLRPARGVLPRSPQVPSQDCPRFPRALLRPRLSSPLRRRPRRPPSLPRRVPDEVAVKRRPVPVLVLAFLAAASPSRPARADVDACIASFDEAQKARSSRKLRLARDKLIACTHEACPAVLRVDCAGVLKEVDAAMPTVVFAADDGGGHDIADVRVYEGDTLLAERIDGAAVAVDPGPHKFHFETTNRVPSAVTVDYVAKEGEKHRVVRAVFALPALFAEAAKEPSPAAPAQDPARSSAGYVVPTSFAILGLAGLGVAGLTRVGFDNRVDEMRGTCKPDCSQDERSALSDRLVMANVALVTGVVALAAAAVTWLVFTPERRAAGAGRSARAW